MGERELKLILQQIAQAEPGDLSSITQAILLRYEKLFPGEEIVFLSLPKEDAQERKRILELVMVLEAKYMK